MRVGLLADLLFCLWFGCFRSGWWFVCVDCAAVNLVVNSVVYGLLV